jgi:DNA-binding winged helix-turn-helix (wHTH) protein/tetratricopeptide (TPR) repeat protein
MRGGGETYRVGDLVVDVASASVRRGEERLVLPPRTFDLLVALVRRHPDVVRREDLLETVWADEHVTDQALSHRVMVLRKALGDRAEEPRYVAGERGWGYRMAAPVERLEADRAASPGAGASHPLRRRLGLIAVAVAVVVVVVTLGSRARRPPALPQAALVVSVRPFAGAPGSPSSEPLGGELVRALASDLRTIPGVRVAGRREAEGNDGLRVEGSWSGAGEATELRLRLVEQGTGRTVWSRSFRGGLYEILGRESEMKAGVRSAVLARAAPGAPDPAPEVPAHVRRLCWRGELFWLSFTRDGLRRSAEAWEAAATLAPSLAEAHAGWALAEAARALLGYADPAEAESRARAEALRAVQLDAERPAVRLATSLVRLLFDWDVAGATAEARAAFEADPDDARAAVVLALALQAQGRLDESLGVLGEVPVDDPHSTAALFMAGRAREMEGRWAEGAAAYARALALEPSLAAARRGRAVCLAAERRDTEALVALGNGSARGGGAAVDLLRAAWSRLCRSEEPPDERLRACLLGGETERAADLLAAAVEGRSPFAIFVPREALLRPLSGRPAYRSLLERLPARAGDGSWTKSR